MSNTALSFQAAALSSTSLDLLELFFVSTAPQSPSHTAFPTHAQTLRSQTLLLHSQPVKNSTPKTSQNKLMIVNTATHLVIPTSNRWQNLNLIAEKAMQLLTGTTCLLLHISRLQKPPSYCKDPIPNNKSKFQ